LNGVQRQKRYLYLSIVFFSLAASVVITTLLRDASQEGIQQGALALLGLACVVPAIWSAFRGCFDLFEPIHAFLLSTSVYFVVVPGYLMLQQGFRFLGVDYSAELGRVTGLALLALLGFSIGYYWRGTAMEDASRNVVARSAKQRLAATLPLDPRLRRFMAGWAVALFAFFSLLVLLWILVARIPPSTLWIFGGASYGDAWSRATGPQIGYLYGAREALPACLLSILAFRARSRWPLATWALLLLLVLFFAGSGARFRVLLLVLGVVIYYYLERGARPKIWQATLVGFVVFYFVIGAVGFYRSMSVEGGTLRERRLGQDVLTLSDAWDVMLGSSQIALSTSVLVRTVPAYQPYFGGASFLNVFTQPIPRFLWPDKPQTIGEDFFSQLWPPGTTVPFWALFYLNFGPVGIVVGMAAWGWISRLIYNAYRRNPGKVLYQVQLALYWPFLIHMYGRGGDNFAFNFYGLISVLLPVWFLLWLEGRWQTTQSRRAKSEIAGAVGSPPASPRLPGF
jgi:oligosaccharide repeat unit polymerase